MPNGAARYSLRTSSSWSRWIVVGCARTCLSLRQIDGASSDNPYFTRPTPALRSISTTDISCRLKTLDTNCRRYSAGGWLNNALLQMATPPRSGAMRTFGETAGGRNFFSTTSTYRTRGSSAIVLVFLYLRLVPALTAIER